MNRSFKKILLLTAIVLLFANAPAHAWSWNLSPFSTAIQVPFYWAKEKITNVFWPKSAKPSVKPTNQLELDLGEHVRKNTKFKSTPTFSDKEKEEMLDLVKNVFAEKDQTQNFKDSKEKEKIPETGGPTAGAQVNTNHTPTQEEQKPDTDSIQGSTKTIKIVYKAPSTQLKDRIVIELCVDPNITIGALKKIIAPKINIPLEELQIQLPTGKREENVIPDDAEQISTHPFYSSIPKPSFLVIRHNHAFTTQKPSQPQEQNHTQENQSPADLGESFMPDQLEELLNILDKDGEGFKKTDQFSIKNIDPAQWSFLRAKRAICQGDINALTQEIDKNFQLLENKKAILLQHATKAPEPAKGEVLKLLQKLPDSNIEKYQTANNEFEEFLSGFQKLQLRYPKKPLTSSLGNQRQKTFAEEQCDLLIRQTQDDLNKKMEARSNIRNGIKRRQALPTKDVVGHLILSNDEFHLLNQKQYADHTKREKNLEKKREIICKQRDNVINKACRIIDKTDKQLENRRQNIKTLLTEVEKIIRTAIVNNDLKAIFNLVKNEPDQLINAVGKKSLQTALDNGNVEAIELLLLANIKPNSKDSLDYTFTYLQNGKKWNTIIKLLDPHGTESQNNSQLSAHDTPSPFIQYALNHNMKQAVIWAVNKNKYLDMDAQYTYNGKLMKLEEISEEQGFKALNDVLKKAMITPLSDSWFEENELTTNKILTDSAVDEIIAEFEEEENTRPTIHVIDALNMALSPYSDAVLNDHPHPVTIYREKAKEIRAKYKITGLDDPYCNQKTEVSMTPLNWVIENVEQILTPENVKMFQKYPNLIGNQFVIPEESMKSFTCSIAEILLNWGANPSVGDNVSGLPFIHAALKNQKLLFETLLYKYQVDVNAEDQTRKNQTALETLLQKRDNQSNTDYYITLSLIERGANPVRISCTKSEANQQVLRAMKQKNMSLPSNGLNPLTWFN